MVSEAQRRLRAITRRLPRTIHCRRAHARLTHAAPPPNGENAPGQPALKTGVGARAANKQKFRPIQAGKRVKRFTWPMPKKKTPARAKPTAVPPAGNRKDARPHRAGKINVTGYFDPSVKSSIRAIQMQHPELTQQDLLEEALDALFARYGVPQTARRHRDE